MDLSHDPLFELFLLNSGIKQDAIDAARKAIKGTGRFLGQALVDAGQLDKKKLGILLSLHARDLEDRKAPSGHPIHDLLLEEIVKLKGLSARGEVSACEESLTLFEGLESYVQLAKVLVLKAQVAAEQQEKISGRMKPVPPS